MCSQVCWYIICWIRGGTSPPNISTTMQSSLGSRDRAILDLVRKYLMEEKNNTKAELREILEGTYIEEYR